MPKWIDAQFDLVAHMKETAMKARDLKKGDAGFYGKSELKGALWVWERSHLCSLSASAYPLHSFAVLHLSESPIWEGLNAQG